MNKIMIALIGLLLISPVLAFNLIESIPISSTDRQEARVDGYWLIVEETNSYIDGYISPQSEQGQLKMFYEGHSGFGHYLWIKADNKIDTVWEGTYGTHFASKTGYFVIHDSDGVTREVTGVTFDGFYNEDSQQVYVHFNSDEFDMSWVTFINHVEINPVRQEK